MEPIYRVEGASAETSAFAGGPWDPKLQHGAAPSSLICWAVERLPAPAPTRVGRPPRTGTPGVRQWPGARSPEGSATPRSADRWYPRFQESFRARLRGSRWRSRASPRAAWRTSGRGRCARAGRPAGLRVGTVRSRSGTRRRCGPLRNSSCSSPAAHATAKWHGLSASPATCSKRSATGARSQIAGRITNHAAVGRISCLVDLSQAQ